MTKFTAAASVVLALVAGSAFAADLPSRKAEPVYVPPAPTFTWTGLYGGVNIGYSFGAGGNENGGLGYIVTNAPAGTPLPGGAAWNLPSNINGVTGGGQVGYNYQFNPWLVIGLEADIQASDAHSQSAGAGGAATVAPWFPHSALVNSTKSVDWFGTVRGRVGLTLPSYPNLMLYGTGGFAYGQVVNSFGVNDVYVSPTGPSGVVIGPRGSYDNTNTGWTAGGGIEWTPLPYSAFSAFSVKVEYLYTDLGNTTVSGTSLTSFPGGGPVFAYSHTSPTRFSTIRAGLNWHFNPFAAAPVVAKY
ncbi:outer membrane protein [Methylocystis heyeri]|uniref:Porin family protein n=1 Tax=Methylocystis heyeri TaxID=391905 RepID=A0A6B8KES9_9HYPH|nr:porin family protein [Methylocystis heyeri]QGM44880.1 porin family protein [Methylocystis heyeri]